MSMSMSMSMSSTTNAAASLSLRPATMLSVSPNCTSTMLTTTMMPPLRTSLSMRPERTGTGTRTRSRTIRCEVALEESSLSTSPPKIGARVKVKVPLKVYHIAKVPEVDLFGMEGHIKQYVALWNGKRISANLPFKVEFHADLPGRGPVKFFAHLKEDEFEYI